MWLLFLDVCFLSQVRKMYSYYVFKDILCLFFFWDFSNVNGTILDVVSEVSSMVLIDFFFLFFCSNWVISTTVFQFTDLSLCISETYGPESSQGFFPPDQALPTLEERVTNHVET